MQIKNSFTKDKKIGNTLVKFCFHFHIRWGGGGNGSRDKTFFLFRLKRLSMEFEIYKLKNQHGKHRDARHIQRARVKVAKQKNHF